MTADSCRSDNDNPSHSDGDSIRVFIRVRPPDKTEGDWDNRKIVNVNESSNVIIMQSKPDPKVFTFDKVYDVDSTQEAIYSSVGKKIIESSVAGYNGTIFAYGQTGSGKTFTMLGPSEDSNSFQHELRGVIPRSFEYLFSLIKREKELQGDRVEFQCRCSFLEIYNEQVFDLLDPAPSGLHLREDMKRGVYVNGLSEQVATNPLEAYQVLTSGWINRRVASTSMNRESSRSHAVFTVIIESKECNNGVQNIRTSKLNLVDLAGSEKQKDTKSAGIRLREAGNINKSLSTLGNVIMSLGITTNGKSRHVPYRNSKLTFLLKDSLGGNAKTHMIACVHPNSKCFSETLSTLQFARRAKMIKNKAVVNEDTQGNVAHLQNEIRRLKDALQQCQNQTISNGLAVEGHINSYDAQNDRTAGGMEWKEHFLQAMVFKESADKDMKTLKERINRLDSLVIKKDKFMQSSKMVIRFRDLHIAKLEKAAKSEAVSEDQQEYIDNLKAEVGILTKQIDQNPALKKYQIEIQRLQDELKHLKALSSTSQNILTQRADNLERLFKEVLSEKQSEVDKKLLSPKYCTPQTGENSVSISTIEKYKSQLQGMQVEIDGLKNTITEQKEASEKSLMAAESELASKKKMNKELEKALVALQLTSKLERESHNKLSTPTKARYHLRNRLVSDLTQSPVNCHNDSMEAEGRDILNETVPAAILEEAHDAFTDEIKRLQAANGQLVQKVESLEAEMMKTSSDNSKLEHQNLQLSEILSKERGDWHLTKGDLDHQLTTMSASMKRGQEHIRVLESECKDLKVVLTSSDKELSAVKIHNKQLSSTTQKDIAALETRVMNFEVELSKKILEVEGLTKDKEFLQESLDNVQDTLGFTEAQLQDMEIHLQAKTSTIKELESELEVMSKSLLTEKESMAQLLSQRCKEGQEQEQELFKVIEQVSSLKSQNSSVQNMCDAQCHTVSLLRQELESAEHKASIQAQQLLENKEAVATLMAKVHELKQMAGVSEETILALQVSLEEQLQRQSELQTTNDNQGATIDALRSQLDELALKLEQQICAHNVEVSMMKEDLDFYTEEHDKLHTELQTTQKSLETAQGTIETQADLNEKLDSQVASGRRDMEQLREKCDARIKDAESKIVPKESENEELLKKIADQASEIENYSSNQDLLQQHLEEYETSRRQKNEEISQLKVQVTDLEYLNTDCEKWQTNCQRLEYALESCQSMAEERESDHRTQLSCLRVQLQNVHEAIKYTEVAKQELMEETSRLCEQLTESRQSCGSQNESIDQLQQDLKRLHGLAGKDQLEKTELQSMVECMKEEKSKTTKDYKEMQEKLKTAQMEHAMLVGHSNHKQKIQFHLQLKEDNNTLLEKLSHTTSRLAKSSSEIQFLKAKLSHVDNVHSSPPSKKKCTHPELQRLDNDS